MSNYDIFKSKQGYSSANCSNTDISYRAPIGISGSYSMTNTYHLSKDYSKLKGDYNHVF